MNLINMFQKEEIEICSEFSLPPENALKWMSDLYRKIPRNRMRCFVIGNFNESDTKFDIYFWYYDEIKRSETYERYVIAPKLRMSYSEEERFNKLCHTPNIITDNWTFRKLYMNIHKNFEEIHLTQYENNLQMLHHIYHSWQYGIEELLYKAELGHLAFHLDEIEEYNLIGSTPAQILELPIGVLRCLNSEQGITALKTHHRRIFLRELYRKYPDMFKHEWTVPQCKYYVYVICEKNAYTRFDVKAIRYMSNFYKEIDFWEYISYLEKRSLLSSIIVIKEDMKIIPALHDGDMVQELYFKTDYLYHMLLQDRDIYEHFLKNQYLLNKKYEYEDEQFIVQFPNNLEMIYKESLELKNCLWSYMLDVALGYSLIFFIREKSKPEIPFVVIEVKDNTIIEARMKYNANVSNEVKEWIVFYAKKKKLGCISL